MMTNDEVAQLAAEHAEHCSHKCCGNGPWSHHPEDGERLCPMATLLAENERLRLRLDSYSTALGGADHLLRNSPVAREPAVVAALRVIRNATFGDPSGDDADVAE